MTIKVVYRDETSWTHRGVTKWVKEGETVILYKGSQVLPQCYINMREVKSIFEEEA